MPGLNAGLRLPGLIPSWLKKAFGGLGPGAGPGGEGDGPGGGVGAGMLPTTAIV
jgi:hypothetical protein